MDLKEKITGYQTPTRAKTLLRSTKITLLVGIAGAGKDTIRKELLKKEAYYNLVTHTTRPPRKNSGVMERDGVEYHFIDLETAAHMLENNEFIEAKFVHGTVYGTSVAELQKAHDDHKIAITDIDVQGVDEYKKVERDVVAIFLLPPNYMIWRQRLMTRYGTLEEFEAEWPKRRESAIRELNKALSVPYYHFIINDELDEAVRIAGEIAHKPDTFHRKDDEARLAARDLLELIEAN